MTIIRKMSKELTCFDIIFLYKSFFRAFVTAIYAKISIFCAYPGNIF